MKPICVPCHRFFKPFKNGFGFLEGMPKAGISKPDKGRHHSDQWQPYKLWAGDVWMCEECGTTIIVGTGSSPIAHRHDADFQEMVTAIADEPIFQVNDC